MRPPTLKASLRGLAALAALAVGLAAGLAAGLALAAAPLRADTLTGTVYAIQADSLASGGSTASASHTGIAVVGEAAEGDASSGLNYTVGGAIPLAAQARCCRPHRRRGRQHRAC